MLTQDVLDGLNKARVMLSCISDEYVTSQFCQVEFRYAHLTLKLPIVAAVVGKGISWPSTEARVISYCNPRHSSSPLQSTTIVQYMKQMLRSYEYAYCIFGTERSSCSSLSVLVLVADRPAVGALPAHQLSDGAGGRLANARQHAQGDGPEVEGQGGEVALALVHADRGRGQRVQGDSLEEM